MIFNFLFAEIPFSCRDQMLLLHTKARCSSWNVIRKMILGQLSCHALTLSTHRTASNKPNSDRGTTDNSVSTKIGKTAEKWQWGN